MIEINMSTNEIITAIYLKHSPTGIKINAPASETLIEEFENSIGFPMPREFREFYKICNGFHCNEDLFNIIPLEDALTIKGHHGNNWFYFAEYMVFSDMWSMRAHKNLEFDIYNDSLNIVLTKSLNEFLSRFLMGNVFDKDGLYDWHKSLQLK